jgi:DNA primase
MVGCSGRSIMDDVKPKWKHSTGFRAEETLYNYWYAKDFIKKSGVVIVVESPGNVWRLEESGIHNSVAIFGSNLGDKQKMLLDISGAMTIITIMDNDDAGKKAAAQIQKKCERTYNIKNIDIGYSDIGEMTIEQINTEIKPLIERYELC